MTRSSVGLVVFVLFVGWGNSVEVEMEELTCKCDNMALSGREGKSVILSKKCQEPKFVIAAKFYTRRALNMEAVARTFRPLWRTKENFHISNAGSNILLFDFEVEVDADKVLLGEPWSYDRHLVSVQRFDGSKAIKDIDFKLVSFWIQIHDIPYKYMTEETAMEIGDTIGPVIKSCNDSEWKGGTFLWVRVRVDTSRPLCRGRRTTFEEGLERWVSFQYERLPNVCFWCGRLSHDDKECEIWLKSKGTLSVDQQQFGNWIRANPFGSSRSRSIEVKGFEPRQSSSRGAMEQNEDKASELRAQTREVVNSGGGEMKLTTAATEEAINVGESNRGMEFREKPDTNKKPSGFEAMATEVDKEVSPIQLTSNPGKSDVVLTNGNFRSKDSQRGPVDKRGEAESQLENQIFQGEDSQSRGAGLLGCVTEWAAPGVQTDGVKE